LLQATSFWWYIMGSSLSRRDIVRKCSPAKAYISPEKSYDTDTGNVNPDGEFVKRHQQQEMNPMDDDRQRMPNRNDFKLRNFELSELVGEGTSATVYRATHYGRQVAAKRFHCANEGERKALRREAKLLLRVNHPNLVRLFDVSNIDVNNATWIRGTNVQILPGHCDSSLRHGCQLVLDYCHGGTLHDLVHHRDHIVLTWLQKTKMAVDIAKGMHHLHTLQPPIIHGDLKSLNVLLAEPILCSTQLPCAKVADFGLTSIRQCPKKMMQADKGHWTAPEIFRTNSYSHSHKIDLYSFAIVLYEIARQKIPFETINPDRLDEAVLRGVRPCVEHIGSDCPGVLINSMVECWATVPDSRPEFGEVCNQLGHTFEMLRRHLG